MTQHIIRNKAVKIWHNIKKNQKCSRYLLRRKRLKEVDVKRKSKIEKEGMTKNKDK